MNERTKIQIPHLKAERQMVLDAINGKIHYSQLMTKDGKRYLNRIRLAIDTLKEDGTIYINEEGLLRISVKTVNIPLSDDQKLKLAPKKAAEVSNEITKDEIITLMIERGLTIEKVIDAVIEANGIVGVGYITLEEHVGGYVRGLMRKRSRSFESFMNT